MCTYLESRVQRYLPGGQVVRETCLPRTRTHLPRASGQGFCRALKMLVISFLLHIVSAISVAVSTGIFVGLGPHLVLLPRSFPARQGIWGELYCRALFNHLLILLFGKASNLTLMCLAIERWFAFVRPVQYKVAFTRPRMLKYLAMVWVLSIASKVYSIVSLEPRKGGHCVPTEDLTTAQKQMLAMTHVLSTFLLPVIVTWGTFTHLWRKLNTSVAAGKTNQGKARARLLRMCAITALLLTVCWLPSECVFILINFKIVGRYSNWRWGTFMLATFNSCVNPWVYYFSNPEYKKEFTAVLCFWRPSDVGGPAAPRSRACAPSTQLSVVYTGGSQLSLEKANTQTTRL